MLPGTSLRMELEHYLARNRSGRDVDILDQIVA